MPHPSKTLLLTAISLYLSLLAAGCIDSSRPALAGQACFQDADCASGLKCVERICRSEGRSPADAAAWDVSARDTGHDIAARDIVVSDSMTHDTEDSDASGRDIVSADIVEQGDAPEPDADANDGDISPVDVGEDFDVDASCCADGCGEGMVCSDCSCEPVDLGPCREQGQLCDSWEGNSSDYICPVLNADQPAYCLGKCDGRRFALDRTCSDSESVCSPFGSRNSLKDYCRSGCMLEEGCDLPGFGCIPIGHAIYDGVCLPIDENKQIGATCHYLTGCEEGALCHNGICKRACDAYTVDGQTTCDQGHCVPVVGLAGVCRSDTSATQEGEECSDEMVGRPCGSDALVCLPAYGEDINRCTRVCRFLFHPEIDDCAEGQSCTGYRLGGAIRQLGRCTPDSD